MTDGTATDRAQLTPAQLVAYDINATVRVLAASVDALCKRYDSVIFTQAAEADSPGRYAIYVSGQLTARLDALRAAAQSALIYAGIHADAAMRGELDTRVDREGRVARMYGQSAAEFRGAVDAINAAAAPDDDDDPTDARVAAHEVAIASEPMAHELANDERHPFGAGEER